MDVVANSEMAVGQGRLARGRSGQSVVISLHQIATLSSSVLLEKKKIVGSEHYYVSITPDSQQHCFRKFLARL
jgi:hypothetical protein